MHWPVDDGAGSPVELTPFSFVCRMCTGERFTRTSIDRWEVGGVAAAPDGGPEFVAHPGTGGPLERLPVALGVACDNADCDMYNEDVQFLADLVEPGPLCWLPGMPVVLEGIPELVVAIDPSGHVPRVLLASGRRATPDQLYHAPDGLPPLRVPGELTRASDPSPALGRR